MTESETRIDEAISIATAHSGIDGAHHKDWVIDQMVRTLAGDRYKAIVKGCQRRGGRPGHTSCLNSSPENRSFSFAVRSVTIASVA